MGMIRKLLKPGRHLPWSLLSLVLVTTLVWMFLGLGPSGMGLDPSNSFSFTHNQLEYSESDGSSEDECDCSAILKGDHDAVEKAKLLTITKGFQKSVKVPDEYYVNATQDCRCGIVLLHYSFQL